MDRLRPGVTQGLIESYRRKMGRGTRRASIFSNGSGRPGMDEIFFGGRVLSPSQGNIDAYKTHGHFTLKIDTDTAAFDFLIDLGQIGGRPPQEVWTKNLKRAGFTLVVSDGRMKSPTKGDGSPIKPVMIGSEEPLLGLHLFLSSKQNPNDRIPFKISLTPIHSR